MASKANVALLCKAAGSQPLSPLSAVELTHITVLQTVLDVISCFRLFLPVVLACQP